MFKIIGITALGAALLTPGLGLAQPAPPPLNFVPADVQPGSYRVEPTHTRILFAVSHMGFTTWYGEFTHASGGLTLDPKNPGASAFDITVPADSISTSNSTLDGELKSPEWFDTAKDKVIEFKSLRVVRTGRDTARVTGALTFHGVTRPETLNVTFNASGVNFLTHQYTVGFNAAGTLKRSDFDQTTYVPLIGDDVTLMISVAFVKS
jgi:polyisoprenoid-binding protein YceI